MDQVPGDSFDAVLSNDEIRALLDRPHLAREEWKAIKDAFAARGIQLYNSATAEQMILAFLAGNVGVPFIQALSQMAANNVADWSKQVTAAVREHLKRKGRPDDAPWIALPDNMTDEAWLALFELVEADELHGKVLRWNEKTMTWQADSSDS
jgi:hypothetical protein